MKKSELKQLIKESIKQILKENEDFLTYDVVKDIMSDLQDEYDYGYPTKAGIVKALNKKYECTLTPEQITQVKNLRDEIISDIEYS